jgi:hypothetical protein
MADERRSYVTDEGNRNFKRLVDALRAKRDNLPWTDFTQWISDRSGIPLSKDILYRGGRLAKTPAWIVLVALSRVPEFTFFESTARPSIDDLTKVLLGEMDVYGHTIRKEANHNP